MGDVSNVDLFLLSFCGKVHTSTVRCCCALSDDLFVTGSLDKTLIVWKARNTSDSSTFECFKESDYKVVNLDDSVGSRFYPAHILHFHTDFVYALCAAESFPNHFYSGSKDSKVFRIDSLSGDLMSSYVGCEGAVCSIVECDGFLIVGTWKDAAFVFDAVSGELLRKLGENHSFAVTVAVCSGTIMTASQNKAINFWGTDGQLQRSIPNAHEDIIRSITLLQTFKNQDDPKFVTVSNDQSVKIWNFIGNCLAEKRFAHSEFIFHACVSAYVPGDGWRIFTSGDDSRCIVWSYPDGNELQKLQELPHPATVWQASSLPNGDIITCCDDCVVRIWTTNKELALPLQKRLEYEETALKIKSGAVEERGEAINLSTLLSVDHTYKVVGKHDGELRMFRRDDKAIVFSWECGKWNEVGEALNKIQSKVEYMGDEFFDAGFYDYVFDVEIGEGGSYKKLPFRITDDPLIIARKFIQREGLSSAYLSEILSFIYRHSKVRNDFETENKTLCGTSGSSEGSSSSSSINVAQNKTFSYFPVFEVVSFSKTNSDSLRKTLLSSQAILLAEGNSVCMSELELQYFSTAIEKFTSSQFLKEAFRPCEVEVLFTKLSSWPSCHSVAVMDMWRMFALHPDYSLVHKRTTNQGWSFISICLSRLSTSLKQEPPHQPLALCCCRFLANLFVLPTNRSIMINHFSIVMDCIFEIVDVLFKISRPSRQAVCGLILNFAISIHQFSMADDKLKITKLICLISRCMLLESDSELFFLLVSAAGTLLQPPSLSFIDPNLRTELQLQLPPMNANVKVDLKLQNAVQELLNILL